MVRIVNVDQSMDKAHVRAFLVSLEHHQCVGRNAFTATSVLCISLVLIKNVKTLASEHADWVPNVQSSTTAQYVVAPVDSKVIRSTDVLQ